MTVNYIWIQTENGSTMMAEQPKPDQKGLFGDEGMTFKDALDVINPLQQLPIIGSIYRELSGDTIKPGARLLGGAIYGLGVGGIVSAAFNNAVEQSTGHDAGGTALAMIKGQSLNEQMQLAQAARDKGRQVASIQYTSGGADPIDPTSLPPGAQLVDVPVTTPNSQLAALPADPAAAPTVDTAPAAAPTSAVAVSPLPPAINLTGSQAAALGAPAAGSKSGDGGLIPAVPTLPPGATGLTAVSHLPTAGSITPAGASLAVAGAQSSLTQSATSAAGPMAIAAPRSAANPGMPTASPQSGSTLTPSAQTASAQGAGVPLTKGADGFPVPARMNNVTPRMPIASNPANVGTQPLALSNSDRRPLDPVTISAARATGTSFGSTAASAAPAPTATAPLAPTIAAVPAAPAAAASQAPIAAPAVPAAQIPDAMMRALDKYDALMRSRRNGQLDQSL